MFYRLQLNDWDGKTRIMQMNDACGDLRIPRNNNSFETLDEIHVVYSCLSKSHLPVPSRRSSLIRLW
jgi:hypothetical protein